MNETMMTHERKRHQHLACEAANKGSGKAHETICLDQLIQINTEEFHGNAKVVSEVEMFSHLDDMVLLLRILKSFSDAQLKYCNFSTHPFPQVIKDLDFYEGLMMESLFIANDLDSHRFSGTVVTTIKHLTERTFSESVDNLISISKVIMVDNKVIASIIIISVVI